MALSLPRSLEDQSAAILAAVAFLAPPMAYAAPLGLAPLAYVGAALGLGCLMAHRVRPSLVAPPVLMPLLALGAWAVLSGLWAIDPKAAATGGLRLLGSVLGGAVLFGLAGRLDGKGRRRVLWALAAGFLLNVLVLVLDFVTGGEASRLVLGNSEWDRREVFWLNRDLAVMILLVWPLLQGLPRRGMRIAGFAALPLLALAAAGIHFNTALLAIGAGLGTMAAAIVVGRWAAPILGGIAAVAVLTAPLVADPLLDPLRLQAREVVLPNSAYHRAIIWKFAADRIAERPVFGWGMATSPKIPGGDQEVVTSVAATGARFVAPLMPLHPHNGPLQVWLELGVAGAIALAVFLFQAAHRSVGATEDRWSSVLIAGQYATALTFFAVSVGAWQGWWHGALWIAATLMAVAARPQLAVSGRT